MNDYCEIEQEIFWMLVNAGKLKQTDPVEKGLEVMIGMMEQVQLNKLTKAAYGVDLTQE